MAIPANYGSGSIIQAVPNDVNKNVAGAILSGNSGIPVTRIVKMDWATAPVTASITGFLSAGAVGLNNATATVTKASFDGARGVTGANDVPRNLVVTVSHATSVVALSGVLTGRDVWGRTITEAWSVTATGTSKTFTGAKAFAFCDSITITSTTNATTDTIQLGFGTVLGLTFPCSAYQAVSEIMDGAKATAGTVVAASTASTADYRGTYTPNSAPNSSRVYTIWYVSDSPATI